MDSTSSPAASETVPARPRAPRSGGPPAGSEAPGRGLIDKIREFLLGVRVEMEKVSWPQRNQVQSATILILILVAIMASIIGVLDLVITQVLKLFFRI